MSLVERIGSRRDKKAFSEPPFWSLENQSPFLLGGVDLTNRETIENDFTGYVRGAYKRNGAIFACMAARQMVFSEARFMWRRFQAGRPGELFGNQELALLERPWPGGTTGELLAHMIQDADLAGNFFATTTDDNGRFGRAATGPGRRIVRMRPDWVRILLGSKSGDVRALDTKILLYEYEPPGGDSPTVELLPDEVCHFSPIPDPEARFRGMSWLTPILREIESDTLAVKHKKNFFENAAVPNIKISFDKDTSEDAFDEFVEKFNTEHKGSWNAYKTLFLMGGADAQPLSFDFRQLEFNQSIGKSESRMAAAAGVPSSWIGFSEGLQGSALNAGNFTAARRRFADGTIRPLWRQAASALEPLLDGPGGSVRLWYDDRDIAFLREDSRDQAEIYQTNLSAIETSIRSGFDPDASIQAARDYDVDKLLRSHTNLVSVQMSPPTSVDHQDDKDNADLVKVQAESIASLISSSAFTEESVVEAVTSGDLDKLEKRPKQQQPQPPLVPGEQPPSGDGNEAIPPAPENEDDDVPGGGQ